MCLQGEPFDEIEIRRSLPDTETLASTVEAPVGETATVEPPVTEAAAPVGPGVIG